MHKIPHSFDPCDCFVFRLYAKLLSNPMHYLAYCAIFLKTKTCKNVFLCSLGMANNTASIQARPTIGLPAKCLSNGVSGVACFHLLSGNMDLGQSD